MPKSKFLKAQRRSFSERQVRTRETVQRFLIVCEGQQTEPNYFRSFRLPRDVAEVHIRGAGANTVRIVQEAINLKRVAIKERRPYDQIWCVFDRDSFPATNFNEALDLARQQGLKVAYSNQAFELWYLLHYDYVVTGIDRAHYIVNLEARIGGGYTYKKNSTEMYERLLDLQDTAIRNAQRLLTTYNPCRPAEDNPSTTVHLLVQELNKYSR